MRWNRGAGCADGVEAHGCASGVRCCVKCTHAPITHRGREQSGRRDNLWTHRCEDLVHRRRHLVVACSATSCSVGTTGSCFALANGRVPHCCRLRTRLGGPDAEVFSQCLGRWTLRVIGSASRRGGAAVMSERLGGFHAARAASRGMAAMRRLPTARRPRWGRMAPRWGRGGRPGAAKMER